jgi:hypothetical protein
MIDETKFIKAQQILDSPEAIYNLERAYIMLTDTSMTMSFTSLMEAINMLHEAGWEVNNMTNYGSYMFVLMKNLNYKKKNAGGDL